MKKVNKKVKKISIASVLRQQLFTLFACCQMYSRDWTF